MNQVQINDIRGALMIVILFAGVVLTIRSVFINTGKRILWIYKWTGVRYKQLLALSGCIFFCTLSIGCLDDAQRIVTVGSSFSNWFAIGSLPAAAYHYAVLLIVVAMLPFNFALFLYKTYHTEKGNPNVGILAEILIFTALPAVMVLSHDMAGIILFMLGKYVANDLYGAAPCIKAGLFLLSMIFLLYDTYTVKRGFDYTKLDVKKEEYCAMPIWEKEKCVRGVKKSGLDVLGQIRNAVEMLYWRLKHRK